MADHQFGVPTPATQQFPLSKKAIEFHHDRWVLIAARDDDFDLVLCEQDGVGQWEGFEHRGPFRYEDFFAVLSELFVDKRRAWVIGWRMRWVLQKAGLLAKLKSGAVTVEMTVDNGGKIKRKGRYTNSRSVLEIDCKIGKGRFKLLDFDNYGFAPGVFNVKLVDVCGLEICASFVQLVNACNKVGLSLSKATAAQMGWAGFRKCLMPSVLMVNRDFEARSLERMAYFGGRCEPFLLGDVPGKVYSVDVKSCYADICSRYTVPTYLIEEYREGCAVNQITHNSQDHWIAEVVIETDQADYPLLWRDKPIYPTGIFKTALCWPELKHALRRKRVKHVLRAARYHAVPAFKRYAEWFFQAKRKLNDAGLVGLHGFLKSVFNSSLGYSARRKYTWMPWENPTDLEWAFGYIEPPDGSSPLTCLQIIDSVGEWLRVGGEPYEAMPMLHATITSWARLLLLTIMDAAGRENVLYVDTDGLLVKEAGFHKLSRVADMMGSKPGELVERFPAGSARIQGQKNYRIGDNWINSGVVRTRHSKMVEKAVLDCDTARWNANGEYTPWEFAAENEGGERDRWVNFLKE